MAQAKHIATFPLYACHPLTLQYTKRQIGTGYIYKVEQIAKERERLERHGHPFRLRWRNERCRQAALAQLATIQKGSTNDTR